MSEQVSPQPSTFEGFPTTFSAAPLAVVYGNPVTEMPRDLYIPPDALEVFLEAFEGPLDLLLYLIRRQNLDVLDIPIAEITRQYMQYVEMMKDLRLELAAEYLVMAAMLAEIKSRMLLPRPPTAEEETDPRAELVRRLQEYERFKQAADELDVMPRIGRDLWLLHVDSPESAAVKPQPVVTLPELVQAMRDLLTRSDLFSHHHVQREPLSVRERMTEVLAALSPHGFLELTSLLRAEEGRLGLVVTFLAVLELLKDSLIDLVQTEPYGVLHVRAAA